MCQCALKDYAESIAQTVLDWRVSPNETHLVMPFPRLESICCATSLHQD